VIERAFEAIETANREGLRVGVDTFPEVWGPGLLMDLFPQEVMRHDLSEVLRLLRDPGARRVVAEHFARADSFLVRAAGYEHIYLSANPLHPQLAGRSLTDLAAAAGTALWEWSTDMLLAAGTRMSSVCIRHVYATEDHLRRVLRLPYCSLGSDGLVVSGEGSDSASPISASAYGYAARTLEHYAGRLGLLSLEGAIRRLTSLAADAAGLGERGRLQPGAAADVVVLDLERLHDRSSPEDPARHPVGIDWVFVSGQPVVSAGASTGVRPGSALRPGGVDLT
jgi:N-acyl-D-amino-acid deacylase